MECFKARTRSNYVIPNGVVFIVSRHGVNPPEKDMIFEDDSMSQKMIACVLPLGALYEAL